MKQTELDEILEFHKKWLNDEPDGVRADLKGADLGGANLKKANLKKANLQWANLQGANLEKADLGGANLEKADLKGANLQWADLQGADLGGANLDFSCFPIWCGSFNMKVSPDFVRQLLYHICRLDIKPTDKLKQLLESDLLIEEANEARIIKRYNLDEIKKPQEATTDEPNP